MNVVGSFGRHCTFRKGVGPGWAICCGTIGGGCGGALGGLGGGSFGGIPPPNGVYKVDGINPAFIS